jgi:DNA-binding transcriptional ArsR family regulator
MGLWLRKRLHIATLGLYRNLLVEHLIGIRGADRIAIIYTKENKEDLQRIKTLNEEIGIPVIPQLVDPWDYFDVLSGILEVVSKNDAFDIEYNISCGTRVMTAAAFKAALITDSPVFFVTSPEDIEIGDVIQIEPASVSILTQPKREILRRLEELGGAVESQKELGSRVDLGASSISRHVNALCDAGYVMKHQGGRKQYLEITELGRIVLNLKRFRRNNIWRDQ